MKLCIPTLCRYDLLVKLIQSVEQGSELPDEYIIVDNGRTLDIELVREIVESERYLPIHLVVPGINWGVARSWNYAINMADEKGTESGGIVISNDDVLFNKETFAEMANTVKFHPFADGLQWALFAQNSECKRRVGLYDQKFYPAYYEDTDYLIRMARADIVPFNALSTPVNHVGWATTRGSKDAAWINYMREKNRQYFIQKWGYNGPHEHCVKASYLTPFNGILPEEEVSKKSTLRLSIIIPSINRNTLLSTVQSIATQLDSDDEIIIVFDGPGHTYLDLSTLKYKGSIVQKSTPTNTKNLGASQRDLGISVATGTHLLFCDDDDMFVEEALASVRTHIKEHPTTPLVFQMKFQHDGKVLWEIPEVKICNVGTPMFVVPKVTNLPKWSDFPMGFHDFWWIEYISKTIAKPIFIAKIISLIGPRGHGIK